MHVNQVLINLLGNAVKYTEPSGTVSLAVEELRGDERVEYAAQHGLSLEPTSHDGFDMCIRLIRFIVEDDGIGMSKEFMSRLFDPFEREEVLRAYRWRGLVWACPSLRTSPISWAVPYRCKASEGADRVSRWCCRSKLAKGMRANCSWRSPSRPSARMLRFRRCHALAACARATCGRQRDHRRDSGGDHRFDGRHGRARLERPGCARSA